VVVRVEMSSLWENYHWESSHQKDLLREQALRVLFRGLHAQMDPALVKAPNISFVSIACLRVLFIEFLIPVKL